MPSARLVYLQYIRAIAALAVVLYHLGYYTSLIAGFTGLSQVFTGYFGYFGVVAFFTISGYLMSSLIQDTSIARFIAHRFLRIYPIYWLIIAILYLLRLSAGMHRPVAPLDLLLFPRATSDFFLSVEWTLVYEVFYYAATAFFCLAALRRYHIAFLSAWLAICIGVFVRAYDFAIASPADARHILTSMWNIPFLLGGLGYYALRHIRPQAWWFLIGASMLLASDIHGLQARGILGPLSCALIILYLIHRNEVAPPKQPNQVLLALGDYSYGLYLVHVTVILFALNYLARIHPRQEALDSTITFGVVLAAGSAAGALDVWLYRLLKRFADSRLGHTSVVQPIEPAAVKPMPSHPIRRSS